MQTKLKRVLSCMAVLALTAGLIAKAAEITELKLCETKFHGFFEHAEDFDVLFMGSSHMVNGVFPLELWNDYGITSFNMGGHANHIPTTYWEYMNALDYADPDVVVIDCLILGGVQKTTGRFSMVHRALDAFPLSITKIKAALDLTDDPVTEKMIADGSVVDSERRSAFGLLWNFGVFHSRWSELTEEDFNVLGNIEYGAESRVQIARQADVVENPGTTLEKETLGVQYLKKMIEECRASDRDVVLIYLPYPVTTKDAWIDANTVSKIAEECGVSYINFLEEDVVDFRTDLYDMDSHLNPSGAFKVTDYLGNFLTENFHVEDHRGDPAYSYWNDDYKVYENEKDSRLSDVEDLNTYLMLLEDDKYGFSMQVGDARIFEDETTLALLENKGFDVEALTEETKYLYVKGDETRILSEAPASDEAFAAENEIIVEVFDVSDENMIVNTAEFTVYAGMNEREPDESGIILLKSRAERIVEES